MDIIEQKITELHPGDVEVEEIDAESLDQYGLTDITLRPYQLVGVNWLLQRYRAGHGSLLGDEMGLGKTCQTVAFLVALAGLRISRGPHLLISPLSVLDNWKTELKRFAPGLSFIVYTGDKETRSDLRYELKRNKMAATNVVLTTYEICLVDKLFLQRYSWHTLVVDEAHRLKNRDSMLHQALLDFDIDHHVLLTGTPVQNNLRELYSLLCFVAPSVFAFEYCDDFLDTYSDVKQHSAATGLHAVLRPFLLRRVKLQVVKDLPHRSEVLLYHGISTTQKDLYKAILTKDTGLFANSPYAPKRQLMNILMELRKCVNHPYLFDGIEKEPFVMGEHLVEASGKLVVLDQLLAHLKANGHKVLLFSQMTRALDIIQDYLGYRGYKYERLDGSVRGEERYIAIKNFNDKTDTFLFLLSTRAGGVGLNLTSADTVIFLDSDFNPQNDLQAAARAHRIGQTRPVKVVRLVARSTVEEIILRRAEAKLQLTEAIIEGDQFSLGADTSKDQTALIADNALQLKDILKFGVDKLLENDDSTIENVDFEMILGKTIDSKWTTSTDKDSLATLAVESMVVDDKAEHSEDDDDDTQPDMYTYEGTDYSQKPSTADREAMDKLIKAHDLDQEDADDAGRAMRRTNTNLLARLFPGTTGTTRARRPLTDEEKEQRKLKRVETMARRAKQEEDEEAGRIERHNKRRDDKWRANNYTSCSIDSESSSDGSEQDDDVATVSDNDGGDHMIKYVTGDVTRPDVIENAIIVHCVDDSGSWGSGGIFSALSRKSSLVEEQYELAGDMRDLSLGDVHLIAISDESGHRQGDVYVALVVAQTTDRHGSLTGIKLSALSTALHKLQITAKRHKASIHLPRLGHSTPGFNWYGTERLIRKHLVSRGVATYIYYYKRGQQKQQVLKRRRSASPQPSTSKGEINFESETDEPQKKRPSFAAQPTVKVTNELPDFMQGVAVCFIGLPAGIQRTLTRYLVAYDGDVHSDIEDCTSHLVVSEMYTPEDMNEITKIRDAYPDVVVVRLSWLKSCFVKQRKVKLKQYVVD